MEWPGRRAVELASECSGVGSRQVDVSSPYVCVDGTPVKTPRFIVMKVTIEPASSVPSLHMVHRAPPTCCAPFTDKAALEDGRPFGRTRCGAELPRANLQEWDADAPRQCLQSL